MTDQELKEILSKAKAIAIVGAKDTGAVNNVGRYLIKAGYTVYPVHPTRKEVWGLPAYASLADIPGDIDVVTYSAPRNFARPMRPKPPHCPARPNCSGCNSASPMKKPWALWNRRGFRQRKIAA